MDGRCGHCGQSIHFVCCWCRKSLPEDWDDTMCTRCRDLLISRNLKALERWMEEKQHGEYGDRR